jgi:hypothetical protein
VKDTSGNEKPCPGLRQSFVEMMAATVPIRLNNYSAMNVRPTSPAAQLSASLSRFPAGIVALSKRCLTKLRGVFPGSCELVYNYAHSVVVGFGMSEKGYEAIVALAVDKQGVRLYLDKSLPDPTGLLEGTGSKVRSVSLGTAGDLDRSDIKALIQAAVVRSGATFPKTGKTRLIIKTASKTKPEKSRRA